MTVFSLVVQTLAVLTLVAAAAGAGLLGTLAVPRGRRALRSFFAGQERHPMGWAWIVALVAMGGSLYFSDGVGLEPCVLCWYQRIAMYPLVLVLGVGLWRGSPEVWRYALPLPLAGLPISIYHVALQHRPSLGLVACDPSNPCSLRYISAFGFVSIPVMAGAAFVLIAALLLIVASATRVTAPGETTLEPHEGEILP